MELCDLPTWDMDGFESLGETRWWGCRVDSYRLKDAWPVEGYDDPIELDVLHGSKGKPVAIIHPILGGDNTVAKAFAWYFGKLLGWTCIIQHRARYPFEYETLEEMEPGLQNIVRNGVQTLQWLEHRQIVTDRKRTFVMGASMGGITTAMLARCLPVAGFAIVVGGAGIADILCESTVDKIQRWRERTLKGLGIDLAVLHQRLLGIIKTDPLYLAPQCQEAKVYMSIATRDKGVPTATQKRLRDLWPHKPADNYYPSSHEKTLLWLPLILPRIGWWAGRVMRSKAEG